MSSSLYTKIYAVMAVLILALGLLAGMEIKASLDTLASVERQMSLVDGGRQASALVHELQKERGRTVGLITSDHAANSAAAVADQRGLTDKVVSSFLARTDKLAQAGIAPSRIAAIMSALDNLAAHRSAVDDHAMTVPANVTYYTAIIDELLAVMSEAVRSSPTRAIAQAFLPVYLLASAKEHAGLERALGAGLLNNAAKDEVTLAAYLKYHGRLVGEELALAGFRDVASPAQIELFDSSVQGVDVEQVVAWRSVIAALPTTGDPQGVTGKQWFDTATRRIDLIKAVEDRLTDDVEVMAQARMRATYADLALLVGGMAAVMALALVLAWCLVRYVTRNIEALKGALDQFARTGSATIGASLKARRDEFGALAHALDACIERRQRSVSEAAALHDELDRSVGQSVRASERLDELSRAVATSIDATNQSTESSALRFRDTSERLQGLASASAEMAASIEDIRARMHASVDIGQQASAQTGKTREIVSQANEAALKIGSVLQVIDDLAEQTNLLALNATIEAARAGEAGRGFAVVASEVKSLAHQTIQATATIGQQIKDLQAAADAATSSTEAMVTIIDEILEVQGSVASSIEQQAGAIVDIREIASSADGTMGSGLSTANDIRERMHQLAETASELATLAQGSKADAAQLAAGSERLKVAFA